MNNNNNNIDDDDVVDVDDDDNDTGVAGGSMIAASVHLQRDATEPSPLLMGGVSPAELTEEQKKKRDKAIADLGSNLTKEKDSYWVLEDGKKRRGPAPRKQLFPPSSSSAPAKKKAKVSTQTKVSDPLYSAEERKQIEDYIHEVMTEERLKFNNQHRREHNISRERSMKRVCTNMEENKKGCWGTVIHGYYMNDNDC